MEAVEIREVAERLWIWRMEHPHWKAGQDWEPLVTSTFVESRGERYVSWMRWRRRSLRRNSGENWMKTPTAAVVLKPDHVRDGDLFVRRYGARGYGPLLFFREDVPKTELLIEPGSDLPGGIVVLYDGRGRRRCGFPSRRRLCLRMR